MGGVTWNPDKHLEAARAAYEAESPVLIEALKELERLMRIGDTESALNRALLAQAKNMGGVILDTSRVTLNMWDNSAIEDMRRILKAALREEEGNENE